jgi:competence protein ComEA
LLQLATILRIAMAEAGQVIPPTRQQAIAGLVALVLVLALVGAAMQRRTHRDGPGAQTTTTSDAVFAPHSDAPKSVIVDVAGAVRHPGVYELENGARVLDAVRRAGGSLPSAQLAGLNRAAPVVDGQQVIVPTEEAITPAGGEGSPGQPVSLNSGDVEAFDSLDGIGPVTAQKIVDDRTANGPFSSIDDLDRVPGIGATTIESLRAHLTL